MYNSINLSIDFMSRTITVSKKFLKQSRIYGSRECDTMLSIMKDFPNFSIQERQTLRHIRKPYMPTYDAMTARIRMAEDPDKAMDEFFAVRDYARQSGKGYMMVHSWFIKTYGENFEEEMFRVA